MVYNKNMEKYLSAEMIKSLREDPLFQELFQYIVLKIYELDTVKGMDKLSREERADQVLAKALAIEKLVEIFEPIVNKREVREPSVDEIQGAKNRFGL